MPSVAGYCSAAQAPRERLLAIEERKLQLQEAEHTNAKRDRRHEFIKSNLAALLAFLTSIASLFVAYRSVQVNESAERGRRQLEQKRLDLEMQKSASELADTDRKWHLELLNFTVNHREVIFGSDEVAKKRLSQIMLATFPAELVQPLFERLTEVSPGGTAWKEGAAKAQTLVRSEADRVRVAAMRTLGIFLKSAGSSVTLRTNPGSSGAVTYIATVRQFPSGVVVATWKSSELEVNGGTLTLADDAKGYDILITALATADTSIKTDLTFSDGSASAADVMIMRAHSQPFGWRIMVSTSNSS